MLVKFLHRILFSSFQRDFSNLNVLLINTLSLKLITALVFKYLLNELLHSVFIFFVLINLCHHLLLTRHASTWVLSIFQKVGFASSFTVKLRIMDSSTALLSFQTSIINISTSLSLGWRIEMNCGA